LHVQQRDIFFLSSRTRRIRYAWSNVCIQAIYHFTTEVEYAAEGSCSRGCVSASAKLQPSRKVTYPIYAPASRTRRSSIGVFGCVRRIEVLSTGWIVCFVSGCLLAPALGCTTSEEAFYTSQSDKARRSGSLACNIWVIRCCLPFGLLLCGCLFEGVGTLHKAGEAVDFKHGL
jgi:hypothetical protein